MCVWWWWVQVRGDSLRRPSSPAAGTRWCCSTGTERQASWARPRGRPGSGASPTPTVCASASRSARSQAWERLETRQRHHRDPSQRPAVARRRHRAARCRVARGRGRRAHRGRARRRRLVLPRPARRRPASPCGRRPQGPCSRARRSTPRRACSRWRAGASSSARWCARSTRPATTSCCGAPTAARSAPTSWCWRPEPVPDALLEALGIDVTLQPRARAGLPRRPAPAPPTTCPASTTDRSGDEPGMYAMPTPGRGYKLGIDQPLRAWREDDVDRVPSPEVSAHISERVRRNFADLDPDGARRPGLHLDRLARRPVRDRHGARRPRRDRVRRLGRGLQVLGPHGPRPRRPRRGQRRRPGRRAFGLARFADGSGTDLADGHVLGR